MKVIAMTRREIAERLKYAIDEWACMVEPAPGGESTFEVTAIAQPKNEHGIPLPPTFYLDIRDVRSSSEKLG